MFSKTDKDLSASKPRIEPERSGSKSIVPSIISANLRVTGNLKTDGDVQIDGEIDGDVNSKLLTLGESGVINGAVSTDLARISGTVNGSITARVVELGRTARITGDINHFSLAIEPGAYIQGQCTHVEEDKAKAKANGTDAKSKPSLVVKDGGKDGGPELTAGDLKADEASKALPN